MKEERVIAALKKIFGVAANPSMECTAMICPSNVLLVEAKTVIAKRLLGLFDESGIPDRKLPILDMETQGGHTSICSTEFLARIIKLFEACEDETTSVSVAQDYPLVFENEHYKATLAPRQPRED